jgi:drug/metabolite transporter (DMT)-like permease
MKKQILLLRLSYWAAAIADFSIAIFVLIPERMGLTEIVYPMGLISAVAFSWGILLIIADRKPFERRWILIPTIIVVALLSMVRIIFALNETIEFSFAFFLFGVFLIFFMAYSYYYANKFDTNN